MGAVHVQIPDGSHAGTPAEMGALLIAEAERQRAEVMEAAKAAMRKGRTVMSGITNAKKTLEFNMLAAMALGANQSIEMSERVGQAELVESTLLPVDMQGERAKFERIGFTFGDVVKDDPLFIQATLPEGWRKESTNHAMWSKIVDAQGRERAVVFYKAAFYDRSAHMGLSCRFKAEGPYSDDKKGPREARIVDLKTGETIHTLVREAGPEEWRSADMNARESAFEWLKEHRPNYHDPLAWLDD